METAEGVWDMMQLYSSKKWTLGFYLKPCTFWCLTRNRHACEMMPRTSRLLQKHLPTADVPYIHYNTEDSG